MFLFTSSGGGGGGRVPLMKKKETKLYWQLKEANRFVLICLFIGWLFHSIFALICATVVFIHSFLVSVFSPLPPSPSVCGMASYTTVGRALEPQKPELSVDDMLSEEFGQEYGKRECLSTAEALALLLKDQQNKRENYMATVSEAATRQSNHAVNNSCSRHGSVCRAPE